MITTVTKRDGRVVPFDEKRIERAIQLAFDNTPQSTPCNNISQMVQLHILPKLTEEAMHVEDIQDIIENTLMSLKYTQVAKNFILYRYNRSKVREMQTSLMQTYKDIAYKEAADSDIKRENANIDGNTAMGAMLKYGSEGAKKFNELYVLPQKFAEPHRNGDIHIHDFDFYTLTTTCTQIDLLKLFKSGFHTGHGFLREPQDITSYAALACIAIQSNQNDQHGGQAIVNFDYSMAPGVKKTFIKELCKCITTELDFKGDTNSKEKVNALKSTLKKEFEGDYTSILSAESLKKVAKTIAFYCNGYFDESYFDEKAIQKLINLATKYTDRATYQAMEALIHNLNTMHSRAGAQVPFSSINYGMCTTKEARMVMSNLLLATEAGLGNGETPIFPIQIFRVKEGINFNPGEPNYDLFKLAIRVSAKRLFPNFSFVDAPFNKKYYKGTPETEIAYMGCRTRVIGNAYDPDREVSPGRGNLSFTSINLPRLGIEAKNDIDKFFELLNEKMELVKEQLIHRFSIQMSKRVRNYPFLMGNGVWIDSEKLSADDTVGEVLKHGTLSIGFIGLAETLVALIGEHHGQSQKAQELGLKIISFMRRKCDFFAEQYHLNFTCLATPAEGLSGRFVKIDRKLYGEIPGVTDRDYYTNSFHIPVYYNISAFRKIQLEAPYHALTNGGHISYIELDGDPLKNLDAFEQIIRCMEQSGIGYGSINHPVDRDPVCGYTGVIDDECPCCHRRENEDCIKFERIRRITGYLVGTVDRWNNAKRAEEHDRVKHGLK